MRNRNNIIQHEFIGLEVEILDSPCKDQIGLIGTVLDETRNMMIIETTKQKVKVPKSNTTFRFCVDNENVIVPGNMINVRSEDRTKRLGQKKIQMRFKKIQNQI